MAGRYYGGSNTSYGVGGSAYGSGFTTTAFFSAHMSPVSYASSLFDCRTKSSPFKSAPVTPLILKPAAVLRMRPSPTLPYMPSIAEYTPPSSARPSPVRSMPYSSPISNIRPYRTPLPPPPPPTYYSRPTVRNTANIDVTTRPMSRKERDPYSAPIKRDFTVGTLKRGRQVIRIQTNRLPIEEANRPAADPPPPPESPAPSRSRPMERRSDLVASRQEAASPVRSKESNLPALPRPPQAQKAYGAVRQKKTPGEKLKEKFMVVEKRDESPSARLLRTDPSPTRHYNANVLSTPPPSPSVPRSAPPAVTPVPTRQRDESPAQRPTRDQVPARSKETEPTPPPPKVKQEPAKAPPESPKAQPVAPPPKAAKPKKTPGEKMKEKFMLVEKRGESPSSGPNRVDPTLIRPPPPAVPPPTPHFTRAADPSPIRTRPADPSPVRTRAADPSPTRTRPVESPVCTRPVVNETPARREDPSPVRAREAHPLGLPPPPKGKPKKTPGEKLKEKFMLPPAKYGANGSPVGTPPSGGMIRPAANPPTTPKPIPSSGSQDSGLGSSPVTAPTSQRDPKVTAGRSDQGRPLSIERVIEFHSQSMH